MADLKASNRRVILQKVSQLVQELVQLNETAYRQTIALEATDIATGTIDTIVELTLDAGGLSGVANTISEQIQGILDGTIDVAVSSVNTTLSWEHGQEG